jgi:hypothetical protein
MIWPRPDESSGPGQTNLRRLLIAGALTTFSTQKLSKHCDRLVARRDGIPVAQ